MPGPTTQHKIGSETFDITDAQPNALKESFDAKNKALNGKFRSKTSNPIIDNFLNKLLDMSDEYRVTMNQCIAVRVAQNECHEKITLKKFGEFTPKFKIEYALFAQLKAQVASHGKKGLDELPEFTDEIKAQIPEESLKDAQETYDTMQDIKIFCDGELKETTDIHNRLLRIVNGLNNLKAAKEAQKAAAGGGVAPASPDKTATTKVTGPLFQPKENVKGTTLNAGGQAPKPSQPSQKKV